MQLDSLRIFISYPRGGEAHSWAEAVHAHLADHGAKVFRDEVSVPEGDLNWSSTIENGLLAAELVVAIVGPDSQVSRWQTRELLRADALGLPVVALRIADVALPFPIAERQPVEARPDQLATLTALIAAILRCAPISPPHPVTYSPTDSIPSAQRRDEIAWLDLLLHRSFSDREALYVPLEGLERTSLSAERALKSVRMDTDAIFNAFGVTSEAARQVKGKTYSDVLDAYRDLGSRPVRRLAVLGEPGAGKSFSLERIAVAYARRAHQDARLPIPLLVPLGLWTRNDEPLEDFIAHSLGEVGRYFPALIAQRRAVLLLDAINEIPPSQRRLKTAQIKSLAADERFASFVVSCREKDFTDFSLPFDTLTLQPLTPPRVRDFLHRFFALTRGQAAEDEAEAWFWLIAGGAAVLDAWNSWCAAGAEALFWTADNIPNNVSSRTRWQQDRAWREARSNPRSLLRLAANPYLLHIMARLPVIPANRAQLFQGFLKVLYTREAKARAVRSDPRVPEQKAWLEALAQVAEALQRLGGKEDQIDDGPALAMFILQRLDSGEDKNDRESWEYTNDRDSGARTALRRTDWPAALNAEVLDFARDASVLELRGDDLRFTHQLLQEYLASRLLFDASRGSRPAGDFWPAERWWERSSWEVVAEIAVESCGDDRAAIGRLVTWIAEANPVVAVDIWRRAGKPELPTNELSAVSSHWLLRMTDPECEPLPHVRARIGRAMACFGLDRRRGIGLRPDGLPDIDWIHIPGPQPFIYQEAPHAGLPAFDIARYPITNAQFQAFIDAGTYRDARWWAGFAERIDAPAKPEWDEPNSPRVSVSWYEAAAFCRWLSDAIGQTVTLPTEEQWERAARGLEGRDYPWGSFVSPHMNCIIRSDCIGAPNLERTSAVGLYPQGATPEGVMDLAGNVREWCANELWNPSDEDEPEEFKDLFDSILEGMSRVCRGGSWNLYPKECRATFRKLSGPCYRSDGLGFRVCRGSPIDPRDAASLDTEPPSR